LKLIRVEFDGVDDGSYKAKLACKMERKVRHA
jgi:hypothetical protein